MAGLPLRSPAGPEQAGSSWHPRTVLIDLLIGCAVVVGLWVTVVPPMGRGWQAVLAVLAVASVAMRSVVPLSVTLAAVLATGTAWLLHATADPGIAVGLCLFAVAERRGTRVFPWWLWLTSVAVSGLTLVMGGSASQTGLQVLILSTVVVSAAWALGTRSRQVKQEAAARARDEERLRLAREVHDVLSHSLGTIGVQAGVAAHVAALGPDELRRTLREVESDARASLAELTNLLQAVRQEGAEAPGSRLSAEIQAMTLRLDRAGIKTETDVPDDVEGLPLVVRQAIRRVLQEATTNVIRHSGATTCRIVVATRPGELVIEVHDDGHGVGPVLIEGHGVTGMRERAAILHGRFEAGNTASGFLARAVLPLDGGVR